MLYHPATDLIHAFRNTSRCFLHLNVLQQLTNAHSAKLTSNIPSQHRQGQMKDRSSAE